jgi:hypothetical protein
MRLLDYEISNGVLLGKFNEENGLFGGGSDNIIFVDTVDLKNYWTLTTFEVKTAVSVEAQKSMMSALKKMIHQLGSYGVVDGEIEDFETVESDCHILKDILFSDMFEYSADLESYIERRVKESFPADFADEVLFGQATNMYYVVYEVRNEFRALLNLVEEKS